MPGLMVDAWHREWAPLDDGLVDLRYLFAALDEIDYRGWIVMSDVGESRANAQCCATTTSFSCRMAGAQGTDDGSSSRARRPAMTRRGALRLMAMGAGASVLVACGLDKPRQAVVVDRRCQQARRTAAASEVPGRDRDAAAVRRQTSLRACLHVVEHLAGVLRDRRHQDMYDKLATYDVNLQPVPHWSKPGADT
jgi:hypothetical protein